MDGVGALVARLRADHPVLTDRWALWLVRAYGTEAAAILQGARSVADMGRDVGATRTKAEVIWLMDRAHARRAGDVLWRRSKPGLRLDADQIAALEAWMDARLARAPGRAAAS